jgi:hypothetical protein
MAVANRFIHNPMNTSFTKPPDIRRGRRGMPAMLVLLACCAAVVAVPIWIHKTRSAPARATVKTTASAKPIANSRSAAVPRTAHVKSTDNTQSSSLGDLWGIQFRSIELTRGNTAVDLRYTIVAPERAAVLAQGDSSAYLVDLGSGKMLPLGLSPQQASSLSTHSQARSMALMMREAGGFPPSPNRLAAGKTYSILLRNEGGMLKRGSRVVVTVGNLDCSTDVFTLR